MKKILVLATSRKTRGGITSVIKAHETGEQWKKYHCRWIETHRDGPMWRKMWYLMTALLSYIIRIPFYDAIHVHFSLPPSARRKKIFVRIAKMMNKRIIIHLHCGSQINDIWNPDYDYLFSVADRCVFLSQNLQTMVEEHTGKSEKYHVIYNPCPPTTDTTDVQKRNQILFTGTLIRAKGYADMIRAFAKIAKSHQEWQIVFAGNGEIEHGKRIAKGLGIEKQTIWLGWVKGADKDKAFREASIFCLPSYAEGFPMAVLDAWSYGLPVITTPVGGIPDVAKDGENMLLFNPGDVNALAICMERMITDMELRNKISGASLELAKTTFNIDTINKQIEKLYDELLS